MTAKPEVKPVIICTRSNSNRFEVGEEFTVEGGSPFGSVMAKSSRGILHSFFATKDDLYYCPNVGDTSVDPQHLFELTAV